MSDWISVESCPEAQDVMFGWAGKKDWWIGRMRHKQARVGAEYKDYFWGPGAYSIGVNGDPPTHWMPLPEPPK